MGQIQPTTFWLSGFFRRGVYFHLLSPKTSPGLQNLLNWPSSKLAGLLRLRRMWKYYLLYSCCLLHEPFIKAAPTLSRSLAFFFFFLQNSKFITLSEIGWQEPAPLYLVIPTQSRKTWLFLFSRATFSWDTSPSVPASDLKDTYWSLIYSKTNDQNMETTPVSINRCTDKRICDVYIQWNLIQLLKGRKSCHL